MMRIRSVPSGTAVVLLSLATAHGQWIVDPGGGGTHTTIQSAIGSALDGDEIVVMPAVYLERINYQGKSVRIRSSDPDDPAVVAATVIDGGTLGPTVTIAGGEDDRASLEGFTVRNGHNINGGGIHCAGGSTPLIANNHVTGCFAVLFGGGIYVSSANPSIRDNRVDQNVCEGRGAGMYLDDSSSVVQGNIIADNFNGCGPGGGIHLHAGADDVIIVANRIVNNTAVFGGGISSEGTSPTIEGNVIENNFGDPRGGGLSCIDGDPLVANNFIAGNRAEVGGALECNNADTELRHNAIIGNNTEQSAVILLINNSDVSIANNIIAYSPNGAAIHALTGSTASIDYNCFFANSSGNFAGSASPGVGNLFEDPALVQVGTWDFGGTPGEIEDDNWLSGDEHLRPDSVCIDSGDPAFIPRSGETDIDGDPRVSHLVVDIGGDEVIQPGPPGSGDRDGDGDVDLDDYEAYLDCVTGPGGGVPAGCEVFEFDNDGDVDFADFKGFQSAFTGSV